MRRAGERRACIFAGYTVHGCTHLRKCMPYRDPAQRAAWMREYRRRKRGEEVGSRVLHPSPLSAARAPEPSRVPVRIIESARPQPRPPNTWFSRRGVRSSFKTALELARTFPSDLLASRVCPYCYNTGYSSPGTRCSYCQGAKR
jgi:hypothetical protein